MVQIRITILSDWIQISPEHEIEADKLVLHSWLLRPIKQYGLAWLINSFYWFKEEFSNTRGRENVECN